MMEQEMDKIEDLEERVGNLATVSNVFFECVKYNYEKAIKRLKIAIIILSILLAVSLGGIAILVDYCNQFEKVTETTETTTTTTTTIEGVEQNADNGGSNYAIGGDYNGNAEN